MSQPYDDLSFEPPPEAEAFYAEALRELNDSGSRSCSPAPMRFPPIPASRARPRISTSSARPATTPRILAHFKSLGYRDRDRGRALARQGLRGPHFFDVIFASSNGTHADRRRTGSRMRATSRCSARRCAIVGADRAHLVEMLHPAPPPLRRRRRRAHDPARPHDEIDWHRLLGYMEVHWEVLLMHLLNFRWIYPTERDHVPRWVIDELLDRLRSSSTCRRRR